MTDKERIADLENRIAKLESAAERLASYLELNKSDLIKSLADGVGELVAERLADIDKRDNDPYGLFSQDESE
jgi:hypothetical protein